MSREGKTLHPAETGDLLALLNMGPEGLSTMETMGSSFQKKTTPGKGWTRRHPGWEPVTLWSPGPGSLSVDTSQEPFPSPHAH